MSQIPIYLPIFIAILISYIYVIVSAFFVHRKCNYVHETVVAILFGVLIGAIVALRSQIFSHIYSYSPYIRDIIILILLPLMLFEDGYNIRKRKFFQNILYINLYGILGTVINFFVIFWILYAINTHNLFSTVITPSTQPPKNQLTFQTWQLMALAACLCSIDTIVPQKIVNPERYPKLFSIIFGQSIMKDAITITLFDAIVNYSSDMAKVSGDPQFNATQFGFLALKFFQVFVASVLIGVGCALVNTFLFKNFRFLLDEKGVSEVAMILLIGYSSYILSQWAAYSGVISMLFCGITLSHFNIYNLTNEGKISAKVSISALAKVAEGVLFFILGTVTIALQIQQQDPDSQTPTPTGYTGSYFSWNLLLATLLSVIIARFANIYLVTLLSYFIVGQKKWRLNFYEYQILFLSGLVKGAVPFALITTLPTLSNQNKSNPNIPIIAYTGAVQNTVVIVVFITSLFFNTILPKLLRSRVGKIDAMIKNNQDHPSLYDSLLVQIRKKQAQQQKVNRQTKFDSLESRKDSQMNSIIENQKQELQKLALLAKIKSTTQKYWKRCEQGFLKPFLIYDYHNRRLQIKQEKIRQRKQEVEQFWKRFKAGGGLDPQNEQLNKFIDVKIVETDQYSQDEIEKERMIQEQNGQLVFYTKNNKSQSKIEKKQDDYELKNIKSNTDSINPIIQNLDQITDIKDKRREYKSLRLQEKQQKKEEKIEQKKQNSIKQKSEKLQSKQKQQVQESKIQQQNMGQEIKSV